MAEIIGLDIVMGMDVDEMQSNLQKAQNQLRQFESQLKKSTNVTEIALLNKEISDLNKSIGNLEQGMKGVGKPTGDATQSLVNLSRIAQDAPYGFMGIANNLNPMLESFQRLQKESGSAGAALKSMAAGLMGPAGLGLALGVVSSIIVKFGDDISKFVSNLIKGEDATKNYKTVLANVGSDFTSAVEKVNKVQVAFESYHKLIINGKEALRIYNDELGKNFGVKKSINEAEETFKNKTKDYINASLQRALADQANKKAAEELLKQKILEQKSLSEYKGFVSGANLSGGIDVVNYKQINQKTAQGFKDVEVNAQKAIVQSFQNIYKDAQLEADRLSKKGGIELDPAKIIKVKTSSTDKTAENDEAKRLRSQLAEIKARVAKGKEIGLGMVDTFAEPEDAAKNERNRLAGIKQFGESKLSKVAGEGMKGKGSPLVDEAQKENDLLTANIALAKERQTQYEKFSETISSTLTNSIMGLWDAFEKGQDIGDALGNMFMDLAKQIAAAAIKAAIFSTIMSVIMPGSGAAAGAAGGGGFFSMFKGLLGLAEGGIVNKPTLAMVGEGNQSEAVMPLSKLGSMMQNTFDAGAMNGTGGGGGGQFTLRGSDLVLALNRSNYSLNLRRGS